MAHGFSVWSAKGMFLDDSEVDVMEEGRGTPELLTLWYSGSDRSNRKGAREIRDNQLKSEAMSPHINTAPGKQPSSIPGKENVIEATQPLHLGSHLDMSF